MTWKRFSGPKILATLFLTILALVTTNPPAWAEPKPPAPISQQDREWAAQRPDRGGAGRFLDSNVPEVWRGVPAWIRVFGLCVRKHESLHSGHYSAHNGGSSAAGAYQFLDSTWRGNAKYTKVNGRLVAKKYRAANHAPAWVQDAVFIHSVTHGGILNWRGTHCGYGT